MSDCIFCKIAAGEAGSLVYEDDICAAFDDINPQAPVHFLVIPKKHIEKLSDADETDTDILGHILAIANRIAAEKGLAKRGYRCVINCNEEAGQTVWHLHCHVLGGRKMGWPPG